jgi:hypothetical protein
MSSNEKVGVLHTGSRFIKIAVWSQEVIFFLSGFLYLLFIVHPVLSLEAQPPVFLKGVNFFHEYIIYPGGLTDWFSQYLMQFWFSDLICSLFIILCLWTLTLFTRLWIKKYNNKFFHTFHLIPAAFLLVLQCQYEFRLSVTISVIVNLCFLYIFNLFSFKQSLWKLILSVILSALLYFVTGGAFFVFSVLVSLDYFFPKKKIIYGLINLIISIALPYLAFSTIVLVPIKQAYLHNLYFENQEITFLKYIILFFYLSFIIIFFVSRYFKSPSEISQNNRILTFVKIIAGIIIIAGIAYFLEQKTSNRTNRFVFQLNRCVKENRWQDVINLVDQNLAVTNPLVSYHTNLALYKKNILLDKMFTYPQTYGVGGLLMNYSWCSAWPEEASNLYWMLGLISESQHWAHEALEQKGYTPQILRRLGMIYMLKGNNEAAKKFFLNLNDVPFNKKETGYLIKLNEEPMLLENDKYFRYISSCIPTVDFVSLGEPSYLQLELLYKHNKKNKMAFEFLIAYNLLKGNLNEIVKYLPDFDELGYLSIPEHVQEALLLKAAISPKTDINHLNKFVLPMTFKRFLAFRKILMENHGDKYIAQAMLQARFGDTYWYYMMYSIPFALNQEIHNETR